MHRADARAREHRHRDLRDHGHVDAHAVALFHATAFQDVGELAHLGMQLAISYFPVYLGIVAFPDDRRLVAALFEVPVEAVDAGVELRALEPADMQVPGVEAPVRYFRPFLYI